jgi:hypothetical protein
VIDKTKPEFTLEGVEVFYNKTTNKTWLHTETQTTTKD